MLKGVFTGLPPFSKLIFAIFIIFISFLATLIAGSILAIPLFGINFFQNSEILSDVNNTDYLPFFKYYQIVQSLGIFIIPPLIGAYLFSGSINNYYGFKNIPKWVICLIIVLLVFTSQPLINYFIEVNSSFKLPDSMTGLEQWMKESEENAEAISNAFLKMPGPGALIFNLFMMAFLPAIGEELLFRGLLQKIFNEIFKNIHIAILITAILFSAMHLQFYGFIPRVMLGMMFGYLYIWTGTIWAPILAHFVNNTMAVAVSYLWQGGYTKTDFESFGNLGNNYTGIILFTVITILLLYYIYRQKGHSVITKKQTPPKSYFQ